MELWDLQYDEVSKILTTKQQAELVISSKNPEGAAIYSGPWRRL